VNYRFTARDRDLLASQVVGVRELDLTDVGGSVYVGLVEFTAPGL
jgi:hypothetical protein